MNHERSHQVQNKTNPIVGILLAAGQGKRFGGDKCLAPLSDGTPMGLRAVQNMSLAVDSLVCVVRPNDHALKEVFHRQGFHTVDSLNAEQGISASLKAGVMASADSQGYLIALADMPFIQTATHQVLINTLRECGGIVRPSYLGQAGHPVLFSKQYYGDLLGLQGDTGARSLLQRYSSELRVIAVDDPGVLQDFDTPDSLLNVIN